MRINASNFSSLTDDSQAALLEHILRGLNALTHEDDIHNALFILLNALDMADEDDTFGTEGWRHHFGIEN